MTFWRDASLALRVITLCTEHQGIHIMAMSVWGKK